MRSDGSTARDRSTPSAPPGTDGSNLGLQRLLSLAAPSLATVAGLLALAVVAPKTGLFALSLVTTVGGGLFAKVHDDHTGTAGTDDTDPRAFLQRYLLGLAGFGGIGLVVTVLFLV